MAICLFDSTPEKLADLSLDLLSRVLESNDGYEIRVGLNYANDKKYTDINGRINVAGLGINYAARAMSKALPGHILTTKHLADELEGRERFRGKLLPIGPQEVKHGVCMDLFLLCPDVTDAKVVGEGYAMASGHTIDKSGDDETDYIEIDGITESEIDCLLKIATTPYSGGVNKFTLRRSGREGELLREKVHRLINLDFMRDEHDSYRFTGLGWRYVEQIRRSMTLTAIIELRNESGLAEIRSVRNRIGMSAPLEDRNFDVILDQMLNRKMIELVPDEGEAKFIRIRQ